MFLILILISFFLGIYGIYYEKKNWQNNITQIQTKAREILESASSEQEYTQELEMFLRMSNFTLEKQDEKLYASKKIFNVGAFLIAFSFAIVGALLYIIYYYVAPKNRISLPLYSEKSS